MMRLPDPLGDRRRQMKRDAADREVKKMGHLFGAWFVFVTLFSIGILAAIIWAAIQIAHIVAGR